MKKLYFLGFIFISLQINAQSIKSLKASATGSTVTVTYDLASPDEGQKFTIELKSSEDNFLRALKEVSGDVGENQSAGLGKTITWDARKEIGAFQGDISFEITATVTFNPLKFVSPTTGSGVKIGKPYQIEWKGGSLDRSLKLELLKNKNQVMDLGNVENSGTYTWNVPKTMTKGENFQFKIFDPTKPNDALLSAQFKLKKTPIILYIGAGTAVVGIAAAVLLGGNDNGGNGGGTVDCAKTPSDPSCTTDLADPPTPPGG